VIVLCCWEDLCGQPGLIVRGQVRQGAGWRR